MTRFVFAVLSAALFLPAALPAQVAKQPDTKAILKGQPLTKWIADLKSANVNVCYEAIAVLTQLGPAAKEAVPALTAALKEAASDENSRVSIGSLAAALGAIGPDAKPAISLLVSLYGKERFRWDEIGFAILKIGASAEEEKAAIRTLLLQFRKCTNSVLLANEPLLKQEADRIMPVLAGLLTDPEVRCRTLAADGLAIYGTQTRKFSPALVGALRDKEFSVVIQAAIALVAVEPGQKQQAIDVLVALLSKPAAVPTACDALRRMGGEAIGPLLPLLRQNTGSAQEPYLTALRTIGTAAIPALKKELAGDSVAGRLGAARILGMLNYNARPAFDDLLPLLKDTEAEVRFRAAQALVYIDSEKAGLAVPNLVVGLQSADVKRRGEAATTLSLLGQTGKSALPALRKALRDPEIGLFAALAMVNIDPREAGPAVPVLQSELEQKESEYTNPVLRALARIGTPAAATAAVIRKVMTEATPDTRVIAASTLARVAPELTREAVAALVRAINQKEDMVHAVIALGEMGTAAKDAVPVLKTLFFDPKLRYHGLKKHLLTALVKMDPNQSSLVIAQIKDGLKSRKQTEFFEAMHRLSEIAPLLPAETTPLLAGLLKDNRAQEDWDNVLETLSRLGPAARAALPVLQEQLKTANAEMAGRIQFAIGRIDRPTKGSTPSK